MWVMIANPGAHRAVVENATSQQQGNANIIYSAEKGVYTSQQNVKKAYVDALNLAVPQMYRCSYTQAVGGRQYRITDDIRDIMESLIHRHGTPSPNEYARNTAQWSAPWDHANEPIEALFDPLVEAFIFAATYSPTYTMEQMINQELMVVKRTGAYSTAFIE